MHKVFEKALTGAVLSSTMVFFSSYSATGVAGSITQAIKTGKPYINMNLRYEDVSVGDLDVEALTLRSTFGFKTGSANGFSAQIEFEDVRPVLGINEDDTDQSSGAESNAIADPAEPLTELDQAFVQYQQGDKSTGVTARLGRQVITLDGHRHVGHVAWRQDKQTFDAGRVMWKPIKNLAIDYSHIYKVNRINSPSTDGIATGFADVNDTSIDLLNVSYNTPYGKAVVYSYNMSEDGLYEELDTLGASFRGKTKVADNVSISYGLELAQQDNDTNDIDTDYSRIELGVGISGVKLDIHQETLGSDDGMGNFQTPLATEHKFLGWADVFLGGAINGVIDGGNGIVETAFKVSGSLAGVKLAAIYHDFESDEGSNDLGDEIDLLAVKKLNKFYTVGLKYADFSAGSNSGLNDTDRLWLWFNAKF